VERFHFWKLGEVEVRKQYQIEITNRFAALENLRDGDDIGMRLGGTLKIISKPQLKRF